MTGAVARHALRASVLLVLLVATVAAFEVVPRWREAGPDLVTDLTPDGWVTKGDQAAVAFADGVLTLTNDDPATMLQVSRRVTLPPGRTVVRVDATVASEGVEPGHRTWHKARSYFIGVTTEGQPVWNRSHLLVRMTGDRDWLPISKVFTVPADEPEAQISFMLDHATGVLRIRDVHITPLEELESFFTLRWLLLSGWIAAGLWFGWSLFGVLGSRLATLLAAGFIAIAATAVLIPGHIRGRFGARIAQVLTHDSVTAETVADIGHFALFTLIAIAVREARLPGHPLLQLGYLMLLAAAAEVVQYFAIDRTPIMEDFVTNALGIGAGFIAWLLCRGPLARAIRGRFRRT